MDEKGLKMLVEADAFKRARIVAQGDAFHVEIDSRGRSFVVESAKGALRTWRTIDAAAKWLRTVGIAESLLDVSMWQPSQRALPLSG